MLWWQRRRLRTLLWRRLRLRTLLWWRPPLRWLPRPLLLRCLRLVLLLVPHIRLLLRLLRLQLGRAKR